MERIKVFRKRPIAVTAIQWDGSYDAFHSIVRWCGSAVSEGVIRQELLLSTIEGLRTVNLGDWIIRNERGEFLPCASGAMAARYEEIDMDEERLRLGGQSDNN